MLIIKKKSDKDYYDGVVSTMGVDKTLVYNRQIIEVKKEDTPILFKGIKFRNYHLNYLNRGSILIKNNTDYDFYSLFIIGFCGKLYTGWKLYKISDSGYNSELNIDYSYDLEYMKSILKSQSLDDLVENYNYMKNYDAVEIFRQFNTPVFVYNVDFSKSFLNKNAYRISGEPKFIINPILKDYQFYKVFDAFQTFQEIQMYLGGVLGRGEKEIVEVEDKYRIAQHGFDKWSFRKEPKNG